MTPGNFDIFLENIDNKLKDYSGLFKAKASVLYSKINNEPFLDYERTLSSVANYFAVEELNANGYSVDFVANEFAIKFKNGINAEDYSSLRNEVGLTSADVKDGWNYCVIDGYFEINNLFPGKPVQSVFVEYKLQHTFVYLDLAIDYLKYKAYTYQHKDNTVFMYVVFDKHAAYPTILSIEKPYYNVLNSTIDGASFSFDKRVFVHIPSVEEAEPPIDDIDKTMKMLDDIKANSSEIEFGKDKEYSKEDKEIIDSLHHYDSRVIKSSKINSNYPYICSLWEGANQKKVFGKLEEFYDTKSGKVTVDDIVKSGSEYRDNLINFINLGARTEAYKKGVRGSNYTSLFLIAFLEYFRKYYDIVSIDPILDRKRIGKSRKNNVTVEDAEIVKNYLGDLENHFSRFSESEKEKSIKRIAYSTLFYVTKLYPIIYDINDKTNELIEKKQYQSLSYLDAMQSSVNRIIRKLKFKKTISMEKIVYDEDKDELSSLNQLFINVLKAF